MSIEKNFVPITGNSSIQKIHHSQANVVISPHPDDDVIGMGGQMALLAQKEPVCTIYMTDGAGSLRVDAQEKIPTLRKQEACTALQIIRAECAFFLNAKSSWLKPIQMEYPSIQQLLGQILIHIQPKAIYMTAPFEIHPTHLRSTQLVLQALYENKAQLSPNLMLWGYAVWGPMLAPVHQLVHIPLDSVLEQKKRAILAHAGEVAYKPYHQGAIARNQHDAIFQNPHATTECNSLETFLNMASLYQSPQPPNLCAFAEQQAKAYIQEIFEK